jgi:hypothetical protein
MATREEINDEYVFDLARNIAAATASLQMGERFESVLKRYVPENEVGDLWIVAAKFVRDLQAKNPNKRS